ncbi:MAG: zinc dependent phospholipase C family protein [Candidatus Desantisbacteria bacterium]
MKKASLIIVTVIGILSIAKDSFAYGLLTHIELAAQTIKILGAEGKGILDVYWTYLMLGAIGPDLFNKTSFSGILHHRLLTKFAVRMLDYIKYVKDGEKKDKLRAYAYGYLTHIAGDIHGHPLAHRLSNQKEHNMRLLKVYAHQDLHIAMKYHLKPHSYDAQVQISLYSLDGDIAQMLFEVYNKVNTEDKDMDWNTLMSCFDRTKFNVWLLTLQANNSFFRQIFMPFSPNSKYTIEFDHNFSTAKKTAEQFISAGHSYLYQLPWEKDFGDVFNEGLEIDCPLCLKEA